MFEIHSRISFCSFTVVVIFQTYLQHIGINVRIPISRTQHCMWECMGAGCAPIQGPQNCPIAKRTHQGFENSIIRFSEVLSVMRFVMCLVMCFVMNSAFCCWYIPSACVVTESLYRQPALSCKGVAADNTNHKILRVFLITILITVTTPGEQPKNRKANYEIKGPWTLEVESTVFRPFPRRGNGY